MKFRTFTAWLSTGFLLSTSIHIVDAQSSKPAMGQAAPGAAPASPGPPDPAKVPIIEDLFRLTKPDAMMQQLLTQYKSAFANAAQNGFNAEVKKFDDPSKYQSDFRKMEDQLFGIMSSRMDWQKMKPQFVKAYSDTFSVPELNGIVGFYKSAAGKAEMEKMPGLMSRCSMIGQQQMASAGPEMQKVMADFMTSIKQKAQASHPAPASPSGGANGPKP